MMQVGLLTIGTAAGAFGLFYIAAALMAPGWFTRTISIEHIARRRPGLGGGDAPWWSWLLFLLVAVCVCRVVYCAAYAVTFAIPYSWGSTNEDGDWESTREFIQFLFALVGGLCLLDRLEKLASKLVHVE